MNGEVKQNWTFGLFSVVTLFLGFLFIICKHFKLNCFDNSSLSNIIIYYIIHLKKPSSDEVKIMKNKARS